MNIEEWFIEGNKLPEPLTKDETKQLFEEMAQGIESAKEKLIVHNIRLVLHQVSKHFKTVRDEKKELVSVGIIGLINAVNYYDNSKNIEFSTYAAKCINNEILQYLKRNKKYQNTKSIETSIIPNRDDTRTTIKDTIADNYDLTSEYEKKEEYHLIKEIITALPSRDREIIMLYFGFYDDTPYSETAIAEKMNMTKANVSRIINKVVHDIRTNLINHHIYEFNEINQKAIERRRHCGYKMKSIYELYKDYSKEQIDLVISSLSEYDKKLLTIRYGKDLEHPVNEYIDIQEKAAFYSALLPKIKKRLKDSYNK